VPPGAQFAPAPAPLYAPPPAAPIAPTPFYPPAIAYTPLDHFWYYPYYYFPHSYWPAMGPKWPGNGSCRYPAWMAYPPFREPHWHYEFWAPQNYYRGFHFWLDQV
jgi:hypothetical protein